MTRRKKGGRPRKIDVPREPNGQPSRTFNNKEMETYVTNARARQTAVTGSHDMPIDVLGIARGRGYITDAQYAEGRRLDRLMTKVYGPYGMQPNGTGAGIFRNYVTPPDPDSTEVYAESASEEEARKSLAWRIEKMDEYGRKTRDAVINAVRYGRYPSDREGFSRIVIGLTALSGEWELRKISVDERKQAA